MPDLEGRVMWPFKKRPPGEWRYGPRVGNGHRSYQHRYWVLAEDLHRHDNPVPPPGGGGIPQKRHR